jgi:hypothetical protein
MFLAVSVPCDQEPHMILPLSSIHLE